MLQTEKRRLREEQILLRLDELGYATRQQLQVIEGLGGDRNAARILKRMEQDKVIQSQRREYKVYYLTHRGKEQIGSTTDIRNGQIEHTLMRNDLYITLGMPKSWRNEVPIGFGESERLICDATFKKDKKWTFVEVDNQNTMKNNYEKLNKYAVVSKSILKYDNYEPTVIFKTVSENRKRKLEEYMQKMEVKGIVYV